MRKVAACFVVVFGASSAFAGVVTFSPNVIQIDPTISTTAIVDVSVQAGAIGLMQTVDMAIGSDNVMITGFTYDPGFITATAFRTTPNFTFAQAIYDSSVTVGGFFTNAVNGILVGRVAIDAAGLAPGDYTIGVSSVTDNGISALGAPDGETIEQLLGSVRVGLVPEPATLSLLGLGVLALVRRRIWS